MKLELDTKSFESALKIADIVRSKKCSIAALKNVTLVGHDNEVKLRAANSNDTIEIKFNGFVGYGKYVDLILIDIKKILSSFKYFKSDTTIITFNDEEITLLNGRKEIRIENKKDVSICLPGFIPKYNYEYRTNDLYKRLEVAKLTVSNDETKPILQGVHFNDHDIVALDGYRMSILTDYLRIAKEFTISPTMLDILLKILKKTNHFMQIETNDTHIKMKFDNITIISRLLQGDYIKYEQLIPKAYSHIIEVDKETLEEDIKFLSIHTKENHNVLIKSSISSLFFKLRSMSANTTIKLLKSEGDNLDIAFNGKYMLEGLKNIEDKKVELKFVSAISPIVIEKQNYLHLLLPVRMGTSF